MWVLFQSASAAPNPVSLTCGVGVAVAVDVGVAVRAGVVVAAGVTDCVGPLDGETVPCEAVGVEPHAERMAMKPMAVTTALDRIMVRTKALGYRHDGSKPR